MFHKSMKGQLFLIGSIIIIVVLVLIRTSINVTEVLEKKRFIEFGLEKIEFDNIRIETLKSAYNTINYSRDMTTVTNSFIIFVEDKFLGRLVQFDGVSVIPYYENLIESTDTPLNVTLFNFFDSEVQRAVLNLSTDFGSPITFNNIASGTSSSTVFTLNLASNQNLTLWIFYETGSEKIVHNLTIPAEIGKTKAVPYFDLRLVSDRGVIRDRFSDVINVN